MPQQPAGGLLGKCEISRVITGTEPDLSGYLIGSFFRFQRTVKPADEAVCRASLMSINPYMPRDCFNTEYPDAKVLPFFANGGLLQKTKQNKKQKQKKTNKIFNHLFFE